MIGERQNYLANMISALVAEKLVHKGCDAYLAYVSVSASGDSTVKDIRTVRDFPNVFLKELPGLPLNQEVEFGIELFFGTTLVSIAPYRMAPKELTELKAQNQELLDHGFICPSVSPWGDRYCHVVSAKGFESILEKLRLYWIGSSLRMCLRSTAFWGWQLEPGKEFTVYSDASHVGLGYMLIQAGKLLKDYDCTIEYHPRKANVVADALSRRAITDLRAMFARLSLFDDGSLLAELQVKPTWIEQINGLKREVTNFVARCLTCQQVKAEHRLLSGLLQPNDLGERHVLGLELVSETKDNVRLIRDRLKAASDKEKSYTNLKRREIKYSVGEFVFLKVSPWKKLELPPVLDRIHDVFHVAMLRRYRSDPTHIVFVEEIKVRPNLAFEEESV
ncbi:uncharacterized protein LOC128034754 [Gossypium raimondii]|uniref:uncharacterized protein LOC128034754 n=1 Tax=Gossypium raimondii TaxID=29730 RepID=UPI00227A6A2F|nr:uncharacterized protein LOC128034754 [Gossypium raimondii]